MTYVTLVACRAIGYDAGVAFGFGAVFRPVRAIGSGDQHQALPVQAKTVVAVVVNAAFEAVLREACRAAGDGGQAARLPAHGIRR